jgi:hypothetical protein
MRKGSTRQTCAAQLTRRGDQFRSYWSLDNAKPESGNTELITVPETLYTGWLAIYGGDYPGERPKPPSPCLIFA